MKPLLVLLVTFSLMLCSCKDMFEDESLTFSKTPYLGTELKMNGYFYKELVGYNYFSVFFLFTNGIAIFPLSGESLLEFEDEFRTGEYIEYMKRNKYNWGLFLINQDTLKTEFLSSYGSLNAYPAIDVWKILNDTTIHLIKIIHSSGELIEARNDTFHFKAFSPKPDSINKWIR